MLLPNAAYAVLHVSPPGQRLVRSVLASLAMPIRILRRTFPAGLFLCCASTVYAAELDVQVTPSNSALRENVENYSGELGDRNEEELLMRFVAILLWGLTRYVRQRTGYSCPSRTPR